MFTQPRRIRATAGARSSLAASARSLAAALAVIAIPATMAATSLGTGTASAAVARPATQSSHVSWHPLTLINGWASSDSEWNSGNPSWAVRNGIVYLSGSMKQASGTNEEFTVLPPAARPAHLTYLEVYTFAGTVGSMVIYSDGVVLVSGPVATNARAYTSLAGVSFPAKKTAVHTLKLVNGWQQESAYGKPGISVSGGMVHFSGALHQPTVTAAEFAVLPKGDRPKVSQYLLTYTPDGTGILRVDPDGAVSAYGTFATTFTSLAGISFQVGTAGRHPLTLVNDWYPSSYGVPAYSISDGIVHLSGSLYENTPDSILFSVLPPAARPKHTVWIPIYTFEGAPGTLKILPDGEILAYSQVPTNAEKYSSLAGISYPLGS